MFVKGVLLLLVISFLFFLECTFFLYYCSTFHSFSSFCISFFLSYSLHSFPHFYLLLLSPYPFYSFPLLTFYVSFPTLYDIWSFSLSPFPISFFHFYKPLTSFPLYTTLPSSDLSFPSLLGPPSFSLRFLSPFPSFSLPLLSPHFLLSFLP